MCVAARVRLGPSGFKRNSGESVSSDQSVAAARLQRTGTLLFGARYHTALAKELSVSRPLLHGMVSGKRRVPVHVERALAVAIRDRLVPELKQKTDALVSVADLIERTYGPASVSQAGPADPLPTHPDEPRP